MNVCVNECISTSSPVLLFSGVLLASLSSDLVSVFNQTYADSTKSCYRTHLKSYSAFCRVIGVPMVPALPRHVSLYCILLARTLQFSSIKTYLNIITLLHKSLDLPSPLSSFMVVCTLRGLKNSIGNTPKFKLPVTPLMLYAMLDNIDLSEVKSACLWVCCLCMFFGLLRKSNLVGCHKILRGDVSFHDHSVQIVVKSTKTRNKNIDPPRTLSLPRLMNHRLCPVAAMVYYFSLSKQVPPSAPLCAIPSESGGFNQMSYKTIVDMVKSVAPVDQVSQYSSHSFRRGGASFMHSVGMSMEQIRFMGDWRSDCFRRYIFMDTALMSYRAVSTMQQHLPPPPTHPPSMRIP